MLLVACKREATNFYLMPIKVLVSMQNKYDIIIMSLETFILHIYFYILFSTLLMLYYYTSIIKEGTRIGLLQAHGLHKIYFKY